VSHSEHDAFGLYRDAVRRRVCTICLDGNDDGSCALDPASPCALQLHLPRIVDAVHDARARGERARSAAVEALVCGHCPARDGLGGCRLRNDGRCAVAVYLPLVLEAIERADSSHSITGA
jgi:hypothetical protein